MYLKIYFRKRNINVRENILIGCLTYAPQPRIEPVTWACVLTGNLTDDLSTSAWADAQPTEPHWPGRLKYFLMLIKLYFHIASKSQWFPDFVVEDSILSSPTNTAISTLPKVNMVNYFSWFFCCCCFVFFTSGPLSYILVILDFPVLEISIDFSL